MPATDLARGLATTEVERRRASVGRNELPEARPHPVRKFLRRFWGLSAWMLELVVGLSVWLGKIEDAVIVGALLVVNAVVGFVEERRSEAAVDALRGRLRVSARVLRDGGWSTLPAGELVPGDVVRVRLGDFVPADVHIVGGEVAVDTSALTGESAEVSRGPGDLIDSGSVVRRGEATAIVVATGPRTRFGRTTDLVARARPRLHVEEVTRRVVSAMFVVVGVIVGTCVIAEATRGASLVELLPLTLVLLLAAVPVALPVMFTVTTALGAAELSRKGVLVTRLDASEDAALMDVLCVDKTGTLTSNRLEVVGTEPAPGWTADDPVRFGAFASHEADQDPIDVAFLTAARERGLVDGEARVVDFVPFDPKTRRTEASVVGPGGAFRVAKGALRSVATLCGVDPAALEAQAERAARAGSRALAVARADGERFVLVGLVLLRDPPRPDSRELIARLKALGIDVKMLTGDALPVAREIAAEVGLGAIEPAAALRGALGDRERLAELFATADGFAEVFPEDKFAVVQALQQLGHTVGMTGDGVNDAPALKQAEVGIAVRTATDVARGAASVALTEDGLVAIVDLVDGGRAIYQRVLTWIVNKISQTILTASFVAFAYLTTGRFVVTALGMVLLLFLTDFAKVSLATDHVRVSSCPERWEVGRWARVGAALGLLMTVEALILLELVERGFTLPTAGVPTLAFEILLVFAMFSLVSVRERDRFWRSWPSPAVRLGLAIEGVAAIAVASVGVPGLAPIPQPVVWLVVVWGAVGCLGVNDVVKRWGVRRIEASR